MGTRITLIKNNSTPPNLPKGSLQRTSNVGIVCPLLWGGLGKGVLAFILIILLVSPGMGKDIYVSQGSITDAVISSGRAILSLSSGSYKADNCYQINNHCR
jgi:hypothetical protein